MSGLYKLTDKNGQTQGGMQWGENVTHRATGDPKQGLCSTGYIHVYEHPLLAILLNPIHANFVDPRLWEAKGVIAKRDGHLKAGCRELTTIREIPLPSITTEQRVTFGILCALKVYKESSFVAWAESWLSGQDRAASVSAAASQAARAAVWTSESAAWASEAAWAAAWASEAAWAAAWASEAAWAAAWAVQAAVRGAAALDPSIMDFIALAQWRAK